MYYLFANYPYVCMAIELGVVVCLVLLTQIEDLSNTYVDPTTECHPSGADHDELDEVRQLARVYDNPTSPVC